MYELTEEDFRICVFRALKRRTYAVLAAMREYERVALERPA